MDTYLALVRAQPLAMAMLQFAVLGTLGDLLGAWLAARCVHWPLGGGLWWRKMVKWALLAVPIKVAFVGYAGFVQALAASACNLEHGLSPRLADWVLLASGMLGEAVIPVTHDKLAIILGATRPSITIALQSLEEGKLIRSRRGQIEVLDAEGLRARACRCGSGTRWAIPRLSARGQETG